jgi:hypothetical protein
MKSTTKSCRDVPGSGSGQSGWDEPCRSAVKEDHMKRIGHYMTCPSVSANRKEKNRLAAVSAALGLTISIWFGFFFMPEDWLDTLSQAPAWLHCLAFAILWAILTEATYFIFRASSK